MEFNCPSCGHTTLVFHKNGTYSPVSSPFSQLPKLIGEVYSIECDLCGDLWGDFRSIEEESYDKYYLSEDA